MSIEAAAKNPHDKQSSHHKVWEEGYKAGVAESIDSRLEAIADAWNAYMHQPSGYPSPTKWRTLADLLNALTKEET